MPLADDIYLTLHPHPATQRSPLCAADVRVQQQAGDGLQLTYRLFGEVLRLKLPDPRPPARADQLWQHTCCEAFVAGAGEAAYREFNFSPSGEWAAYAFADYRQPAGTLLQGDAPAIHCRLAPDVLEVTVLLPPVFLPAAEPLALGLSLVVEELDAVGASGFSYWALHHADQKPDFHRRESFTAVLQPTFEK